MIYLNDIFKYISCPFIAGKYVRDRRHLHVSRFPCDSFELQVK